MKAVIRKAEVADIPRVLADLSKQTTAEFRVAGIDPATAAYLAFQRDEDVYVSSSGGVLLTMFGFADYDGYYSMWTLATDAFFSLGTPGVLCTRRFFRGLRYVKPVVVVTASPYENTDRWLGLLGFEKVGGTNTRREFRLRVAGEGVDRVGNVV